MNHFLVFFSFNIEDLDTNFNGHITINTEDVYINHDKTISTLEHHVSSLDFEASYRVAITNVVKLTDEEAACFAERLPLSEDEGQESDENKKFDVEHN